MKRRKFIQKSAATAVAFAIPWSKLTAQAPKDCSAAFQEYKWFNDKKDSYKIYANLCKDAITHFESFGAEKKIIKLIMNQNLKNAQNSFDIREYSADLRIKTVKNLKDAVNDYKVETEFLQEIKNEYEMPKELNVKKLTLIYHDRPDISTIDVLDKKGNTFLTIFEKPPAATSDNDDQDCFITAACVAILGKPDDCAEISILRKFRDEVLKSSEEGLQLIKEYYHIAPGIVGALSVRTDKETVYTDIYNNMILPTIHCIENDDSRGAVAVYKDYTLKLNETYL